MASQLNKKITNRELSWLEFNARVLAEAADPSVPIMERLKFLGIFSNNRDEFFRVRVASIKRLALLNERIRSSDDNPRHIFKQIEESTIKQQQQYESIYKGIIGELKQMGIRLLNENNLNKSQREFVEEYFQENVDALIGPVMLDHVKKFPQLRDKGIYLAISLKSKEERNKDREKEHHAVMEVPSTLPRFIEIPNQKEKKVIIILDDIIRFNLKKTFSFLKPISVEAYTFKITRDAELDLDNDISKSFLEKMKKSLKQRKGGAPVRFVYDSSMPETLRKVIAKKLQLTSVEDAFIPGGRYHNFRDLMSFPKLDIPKGYYKDLKGHDHPQFDAFDNHFDAIKHKDILLHFPFQSFNHIIEWLKEAAVDPKVKSIKMCLYRVANRSKIVNALINAARNGKKVTVVFELQARFDEENNIYWSNVLEDEGVTVYFGFPGLKVHSKLCLVTRKEGSKLVNYANIGTGNFNESTASLYTDFSLLTADTRITKEVLKVFEIFEHAIWPNYRFQHIILSPFHLRGKLVRLINKEIKNAKAGNKAYINLKMNSLVDTNLILKLYAASKAGVKIKMVIRGVCSLVPGVKGLSENITVVSIIDRFLEHSRVFSFCNNGDPLYYISSADWMVRNLDRRIEVTCPIYDADIIKEIQDTFEMQLADNVKARKLNPDGTYSMVKAEEKSKMRRSQYDLHEVYKEKAKSKA